MPTIVDDGYALWESIAILEYLDERFPSGAKLYPGDAASRGRVRRLIREIEYVPRPRGHRRPSSTSSSGRATRRPTWSAWPRRARSLQSELEYLAKELKGKFLAGDTLSAADFVLCPCLRYCKRITFRKPETKLDRAHPAPLADYKQAHRGAAVLRQDVPAALA